MSFTEFPHYFQFATKIQISCLAIVPESFAEIPYPAIYEVP